MYKTTQHHTDTLHLRAAQYNQSSAVHHNMRTFLKSTTTLILTMTEERGLLTLIPLPTFFLVVQTWITEVPKTSVPLMSTWVMFSKTSL